MSIYDRNAGDPYSTADAVRRRTLGASDTSAQAGASVNKGVLRERVFDCISFSVPRLGQLEGLTCDEVEERTGLRHTTVSARIRELVLAGRLEDAGHRRVVRSGRAAICWRIPLVEAAREIVTLFGKK